MRTGSSGSLGKKRLSIKRLRPAGYIRVSRFDFDRVASEDFLLSPVANQAEIVTDLEGLWAERELRLSRDHHAP